MVDWDDFLPVVKAFLLLLEGTPILTNEVLLAVKGINLLMILTILLFQEDC